MVKQISVSEETYQLLLKLKLGFSEKLEKQLTWDYSLYLTAGLIKLKEVSDIDLRAIIFDREEK